MSEDTGALTGLSMQVRTRLKISGIVQGVGFRPFLHRQATELALSGWCANEGGFVSAEVQGDPAGVGEFTRRILTSPPPAAVVRSIEAVEVPSLPAPGCGFAILPSSGRSGGLGGLSPDLAPCPACVEEMLGEHSRRRGYPLLSCSDCGPRYSISTGLPYDRSTTSMREFPLCDDCACEYSDPLDRRFHAEPLACPRCGPSIRLVLPDGSPAAGDPLDASSAMLRQGMILAVKGSGGYLLAADAGSDRALARLRAGKVREWKPFALMVAGVEEADLLVELDGASREALTSQAAPIVIAPARLPCTVSGLVAPGMSTLGVMLPPTPLQMLLAASFGGPMVMTSGNASGRPITSDDSEALSTLEADAFLVHDRLITGPVDDSVVVPPIVVRRGRGYVPRPVATAVDSPVPILACGADMSATFALMEGSLVLPGRPVGDMGDPSVLEIWDMEMRKALRVYSIVPGAIAADMHPGYLSRAAAEQASIEFGAPLVEVQHHHAHMCAVMAEHGMRYGEAATGLVLDGTGYGTDGTVWGCEILRGGFDGFERVGHLRCVPMPGGEAAIREPARMASAWLMEAGLPPLVEGMDAVIQSRRLSPLTSSAGRLFDAVAAILGLAPERVTGQAQAAMLLESAVSRHVSSSYLMPVDDRGVIDPVPTLESLVEDRSQVGTRAARFHNSLADALCRSVLRACPARDVPVVLAGGCWANRFLFSRTARGLEGNGYRVLHGVDLPAGDGAVSTGQAVIASVALAREGG
jgi:hydrogenase maturation protein HypF